MEKNLRIKLDPKHAIYGRLNGSLSKPLVIVVHGLPGDIYDGLCWSATDWFGDHGFSAFRFNLYGWQKDARQLIDCTLKTHASDLDAVVRYFRKRGVKKIFVVGHSFGGPTVLLSTDQAFDAAAIWDPSYDLSFVTEKYGFPGGKFVRPLNGYFMRWGANTIIGKAMAEEADHLRWADLPKRFHIPLLVVSAGRGVLVKGAKRYIHNASEPKKLEIIKGATHYFDDRPKMRSDLFRRSKRWFERFL